MSVGKKLIFLDIDGTLTESGSNIPPASAQEAVRRARANGHKIILCSGRNYGMLSPLLQYGFDGLAGSAGGYIEYGGEIIYDCPMTSEQQSRVLSVFQESGIYRTVESKTGSYTDEGFKNFLQEHAQASGNSEFLRWREQLEQDLGIRPMEEYRGEPVYKLVFMCREMNQLRKPRQLLPGEFLLLCTDGLVNTVTDEEIMREVLHGDTNTCMERLLAISKSRGASDNVTVVLAKKL